MNFLCEKRGKSWRKKIKRKKHRKNVWKFNFEEEKSQENGLKDDISMKNREENTRKRGNSFVKKPRKLDFEEKSFNRMKY